MNVSSFHTRALLVLLAGGIMLNTGLWLFFLRFPAGDAPLALRYQGGGGISLLGAKSTLATIPGIGLVVLFVNAGLAALLKKRDLFFAYLMLVSAAAVQVLLGIALFALYRIN